MTDDQDELFTSSIFPAQIQRSLRLLRDDELLCDFTILVGDESYKVHKIMMAACSDYFKGMLIHDSLEARHNKVCLQHVSPLAIEAIIDFCYTSSISLNTETVQEVLVAASILQIHEVQNLCVKFIEHRVDTSNCLGVLLIADRCNIPDLFQTTFNFCLDKFEQIVDEKEFLQLDCSWLTRLISSDQLNVENEEKVFEAVLRWLSEDKGARLSEIDTIMPHVRFSLIGPVRLVCLSSNEFVQNSSKCRDLIDEAKDYLLLQNYPEQRSQMRGPRFQRRVSLRRQQRIYAVGGWTNEYRPIASVEKYDPYSDDWEEVSPMTRPRCGVGVTILGDSLYAVGGHDGQQYLKSAERYDIPSEKWHTDVADMQSERTSVGVVSVGGFIYAIGGQLGSCSLNNVERYDPKTNSWEECEPLRVKRLGAGVTVLNGLIYVMGGADQVALKTVECYNPATNNWTFVAPMVSSRKHLGCTTYDGKIYAVGGRGDSSELNTAECYDPELDEWRTIPDMSEKRSGIGLVELDGLLYAVGGHNGDERLKLVEAYIPRENRWVVKRSMIHERLGGGLAVHSRMNSNPTRESLSSMRHAGQNLSELGLD